MAYYYLSRSTSELCVSLTLNPSLGGMGDYSVLRPGGAAQGQEGAMRRKT